jgi:hypothetical protein
LFSILFVITIFLIVARLTLITNVTGNTIIIAVAAAAVQQPVAAVFSADCVVLARLRVAHIQVGVVRTLTLQYTVALRALKRVIIVIIVVSIATAITARLLLTVLIIKSWRIIAVWALIAITALITTVGAVIHFLALLIITVLLITA